MNEFNLLKISLQDYFTSPMLKLILYPLVASAFLLYFLFFSAADIGLTSLENSHIQIEQHSSQMINGELIESHTKESYSGSSIVDFLLKYTITSWIVSFLVYTIGLFAIGYLSIFVSIVIIGFLTPKILSIIHQRHYSDLACEGYGSIIDGIVKLIKTALMMLLLFFVLFPLYFIPGINIIAINLPFYYFFHKMLHFDVGSTMMSKEQFGQIYFPNKSNMRIKSMFLYVLSLVPFVAFFIAVFYIIYLGHTYFEKLKSLR